MSQTGAEHQLGTASGGLSKIQTSGLNQLLWKRLIHSRGKAQGEEWSAAQAAPWTSWHWEPRAVPGQELTAPRVPRKLRPSGPAPLEALKGQAGSVWRTGLLLTPPEAEGGLSHSHCRSCQGQTQQAPVPGHCTSCPGTELLLTLCCSSSHRHKRRFLCKNYARHCKNPKPSEIMWNKCSD